MLLAVSGGKLSEGIDFKDDLCRLVAVVGLPYPNASDMALLEKMRYLDACKGSHSALDPVCFSLLHDHVSSCQRSGEGVVRGNYCPKGRFWIVRFFLPP